MATYFISDVHLGLGPSSEEREKETRLVAFLRAILPTTTTLVIVGDLFDFWFEYRTVIPKGFHRTLSMLQEFTDRGIPVHYVAGNHDFWMGDFFRDEIGISLHFDPHTLTIDGKRIALHHGDGLSYRDTGYRLLKPILRNRVNIWLYRWLHPDIGVRLARRSSRKSRAHTSERDYSGDEGMIHWATEQIRQGAHIVIMGHRHAPYFANLDGGVYINLGDWITHFSYAQLEDGIISLHTWNGTLDHTHGRR